MYRKSRWIGAFAIAAGVLLAAQVSAERARAWEGEITLPSYPLGPEDINPHFQAFEGNIYYPYTGQDNLTTEKVDKTYKAIFLENAFLKVTCLPEIGSRLHSVFDKTTGEEMFDTNEVIKPGLIGLRGAWISGGIEWNAGPQAHTVTSFSSCDATFVNNKDKSATLVASNLEMVNRTRWTVWVTLRPGKAYLEERIRIENPTDTPKTYYFWNNTAFPCHDGTRFMYPMTLGCDHNGTQFFAWPMNEGKDLTWLKNYDAPTSVFAYECAFDFFGAYDVTRDRGIVQFGDHNVLIGKKAWTWGASPDGLASMANLTDDDTRYIEVQSGPLATQADYGLLAPHQHIEWEEWWYPVNGLGDGFEYATKDVAIQTYRHEAEDRLEVRIASTGSFPDARYRLSFSPVDGKCATESVGKIDLVPGTPLSLGIAPLGTGPCSIEISDRDGKVLARYATPLAIPLKSPPATIPEVPEAERSAEQHYLAGLDAEKKLLPEQARAAYQKALSMDPRYTPASRALGVLALAEGRYAEAESHLGVAVQRDPEEGLAWYYRGTAHLRMGRLEDAVQCAYEAVRGLDHAALGQDLAGRAWARLGMLDKAVDAFARAIALAPEDTRARTHLATALLMQGNREAAAREVSGLVAENPLNVTAQLLNVLLSRPGPDRTEAGRELAATIGEDEFTALDSAVEFAELGAYGMASDAIELLLGDTDRPMPCYYRAWLASRLGDAAGSQAMLDRAEASTADYVFPSRPESIEILQFALSMNPDSARAQYYLGNLYAGLHRVEDAAAAWQAAVALDTQLNVAHRNLGMHAWKKDKDLSAAEDHYRDAVAANPEDQTLFRDLAQLLIAQERRTEAIALLEEMPHAGRLRPDVLLLLAESRLEEGDPAGALALVESAAFSNWEGNTRSWQIYSKAHMARGKAHFDAGAFVEALVDFEAAIRYPGNLGVGRAVRAEEAEALYWQGRSLVELGRSDDARATFQRAAEQHEGSKYQNEYRNLSREAM